MSGPSADNNADWLHSFPPLAALTAEERRRLLAGSSAVRAPAGSTIFAMGSPCANYLLVHRGTVKVSQITENGREIVLYRVGPGETCILTTNCLLAEQTYPAEGIAESDIEATALSSRSFERLMSQSAVFRDFVLRSFGTRIASLLLLVEEVVSRKTDCRLAGRLVSLGDDDGIVRASHQELAAELGTAREVVSRQLKEFERRGWLRLERRSVAIVDRKSLSALANS